MVLGYKHTPEALKKISVSSSKKRGFKHTEEAKLKMSLAKKGKPGHKHTEETKQKMRKRLLDHPIPGMTGKRHSEETRQKMRLARKGKTYEEIYGEERAKLVRQRVGLASLSRPNKNKGKKMTPEMIEKNRLCHIGIRPSRESIEKGVAKRIGQKRTQETREKMSISSLRGHREYPRGECPPETREKISKSGRIAYATGKRQPPCKRIKIVLYNGTKMKFNYEPFVAKWLDDNNIKWEYESKACRFKLPNGRTYIIDFFLPELNCFIEVKGRWDDSSKYKVKSAQDAGLDVRIIDNRHICLQKDGTNKKTISLDERNVPD